MKKEKITRKELINKFTEFYKSKNHNEIVNASLIPENDPTVLFTTAGMHPLVLYLMGQEHPQGKRLTNTQKCIRTGDINEVGDTYHHTFFEMLGKWSVGDYFKQNAIKYTFEFFTKTLKIPRERLAVTCFAGNKSAPKDTEAAEIWESLGFEKQRIAFVEDNWWETPGPGPCGPDTEVFYWTPNNIPAPKKYDPTDERWVELGNDVLMQYEKDTKGNYLPAKQKNIDFGGGVERIVTILNGLEDDYMSDSFKPIITEIEKISKKTYKENKKEMRIIADHIKAAVFIIADGVVPGNTEQGYVLRRLVRRAIRYGKKLKVPEKKDLTTPIVKQIIKIYQDYESLKKNEKKIINELNKEENKFEKTLDKGLKELKKMIKDKTISGKNAFLLYQSYGFPIEITKEIALESESSVDEKGFEKELKKHQELSRTASKGRFKSGLADDSKATTNLHTAAHLLLQSLKEVLKTKDIHQKGSNINPERLRLDFSFPRKLKKSELDQVEKLVNEKIKAEIPVIKKEMSPEEAKKKGAAGDFERKYGNIVSVYSIGDFSKEICAGPHVENTKELGKFKIKKETSSSSGVRRIKAILE